MLSSPRAKVGFETPGVFPKKRGAPKALQRKTCSYATPSRQEGGHRQVAYLSFSIVPGNKFLRF